MLGDLGRWLIMMGGLLIVIGAVLLLANRIPGWGRLPGDIVIERDNFTFYAPLGTMIVLSILLTLILNLAARLFR